MSAGFVNQGIQAARQPQRPPQALPGFESIARLWDPKEGAFVARILPGEVYVSREPEMITTVLGSCIAACICDLDRGIGGMNHFMLPSSSNTPAMDPQHATRYGLFAMEALINGIMKHGGRRDALTIKIFGGGKMIPSMGDVGGMNIRFVKDYLEQEGLAVQSEDLGSNCPRKVIFYPRTGRVMMKRLRPLHNRAVADQERAHLNRLAQKPTGNDVELF